MLSNSITIGVVACEISGDILGAGLIRALRVHLSDFDVRFVGVAGPRMQEEGMEEVWYKIDDLSVMGIFEVVMNLPRLFRIFFDLKCRFNKIKPDVFIGIDSPDFTVLLERVLKKRGIRTIHYVSPSIWAWRKNRIFKIREATDNILVLLPFEKRLYDQHNIPCKFVGHTLADRIPLNPDKLEARKKLGIHPDVRCLALLPGSRISEIKMLSTYFLRCAELLSQHFLELEILVPLVNKERCEQFKYIKNKVVPNLRVRIIKNQSIQAMIAADAALLTSGTAVLECMLAKCPMVVGYRMNPLTFLIVRNFVKTPWISLPNILAKYELVKEFIQNECYPENLAQALVPLLSDQHHRMKLQVAFKALHQQIRCNADEKAACAVLACIDKIKNKNIEYFD